MSLKKILCPHCGDMIPDRVVYKYLEMMVKQRDEAVAKSKATPLCVDCGVEPSLGTCYKCTNHGDII